MRSIKKQQGLTAISWLLIVLLVMFTALIAIKITPIYMDSFVVAEVLESLKEERGGNQPHEIMSKIMKRLDINMMNDVQREDIYIERNGDVILVEIEYDATRQLFYNLDIVAHFKKSVELPAR